MFAHLTANSEDPKVARVKKALGSVSQMVKNGNKLVLDQDSSGKDTSYIQNKRMVATGKQCVRLGPDGGITGKEERSKY